MQKLLEKKKKNNKKKKKGEVEGRERPSASLRLQPTRASWPNRPAHTPWVVALPSPCSTDRGRAPARRRRTTSPSTGGDKAAPTPRPPRLPLAHLSPFSLSSLAHALAPPLLSSRSAARAQSPPPSIVVAATGGPAPADLDGELCRRPLHRPVASAGVGEHRSAGSLFVHVSGRRRPSSSPAPSLLLLSLRGPPCVPQGEPLLLHPSLLLPYTPRTTGPAMAEPSSAAELVAVVVTVDTLA